MSDTGPSFDFGRMWREAIDKDRLDREVLAAVKAEVAGKSRAEIRDLVAQERARRDMDPLPPAIVDIWVDRVLADNDSLFNFRSTLDAVGTVGRLGGRLVQALRDGYQGNGEFSWGPIARPLWRSSPRWQVQIHLDPAEQTWLERAHQDAAFKYRELAVVMVILRPDEAGGEILVEVKGRVVGRVGAEDAPSFRPFLSADGEVRAGPDWGLLSRDRDSGLLELNIGTPEGEFRRGESPGDG